MKAIIKVDVPEFQIGQEVTVYYRDTMYIKGVCEKEEEHRWIPVTERLPDEDGDYLVTTSSLYGATKYVTTRDFSEGRWTYDSAVIAWMPLPKPYEEGTEMAKEARKKTYRECFEETFARHIRKMNEQEKEGE